MSEKQVHCVYALNLRVHEDCKNIDYTNYFKKGTHDNVRILYMPPFLSPASQVDEVTNSYNMFISKEEFDELNTHAYEDQPFVGSRWVREWKKWLETEGINPID
jgi:hypothetical protein